MPFCKKCGLSLENDAEFCHDCGTPVVRTQSSKRDRTSSQDFDDKTQARSKPPEYGVVSFDSIPEGYVISGRYEVKEKIGQGGFGAVYRCYDRNMNIDKALKIIPEAVSTDKEAMFDLQQEAQTMIALNHSNIVRVHDFHKTGEIKFIDMEYIDGKALNEMKLDFSGKKIPEPQVKEYALKIAEGMAYAHSKGVLHKDLKPHNIKVTSDGSVKIMDFGISETVRTSMSRLDHSSSSGTLVYMSPEQLRGKNVGREADIYSFGAMLYELLNGQPPFFKGDIQYQIINEKPEPPEHISDEMNSFLMKCLEKDYKNRYRSFKDIIELWGGIYVKGEPVKPVSRKKPVSQAIKRLVPVNISARPKNAAIYVDGKRFTAKKLNVGLHDLQVSLEGYKTVSSEIEITESSSNEFHVDLEPAFAKLKVDSGQEGIPIVLNGAKTGHQTPYTFTDIIPQKEYRVELESDDYYSDPVLIELNENENRTVKPELIKFSALKIETAFQDIEFSVGSKQFGTDGQVKLKAGNYQLKPSYSFLPDLDVSIEKNKNLTVDYDKTVPKRKVFIEAGKYDVKAVYQYGDDSLSIALKENEQQELPVGSGYLYVQSDILSKKYSFNNDSGIRIDFSDEINNVIKKRKRIKRQAILGAAAVVFVIAFIIVGGLIRQQWEKREQINNYLIQAERSIEDSDHIQAKDFYNEALLTQSDNEEARQGLDIVKKLLIQDAEKLLEDDSYQRAKEFFELALAIDSADPQAREGLSEANEGIRQERLERQRLARERERAEVETERQRQAEAEKQRQAEAERQRQAEAEKQRQAEAEKQRQAEAEKQRQAEAERQRQAEAERQRQAEAAERQRQIAEIERKGFVYVEGGTFQMGSDDGLARENREKPVHRVILNDFFIGKYPVTQREYQSVMGNNPSESDRGIGDNHPVNRVSWYEAIEYCNKLSIREGLNPVYSIGGNTSPRDWSSGTITADWSANGYRLPTEAEWEFAARGGNRSRGFSYSGSDDIDEVAWYRDNSGNKTHPVGGKKSNELGVYDMSGNVFEWCWDWYGDYTSGAKTNPKGQDSGSYRVLRGGSWLSFSPLCRVSYRDYYGAPISGGDLGFRVSRVIP